MSAVAPAKKILTVEDNALVSADVRSILEGAGYDVCPDAHDGVEAVEHVRAYDPDLILLDLTLPRVDGFEAASLIRQESDAPILVLTGHNDPEMHERAAAAGTSGLVLKPFSEHGLLSAVRSRLAEREANDYQLRSLIETMLREGADEQTIVRAMNAATQRTHSPRPRAPRPGVVGQLWRFARFVTRRREPLW